MGTATTEKLQTLKAGLARVILGKDEALDHVLVALLAGHHLLMEDVPGVGKTTLAKALARSFSGQFRRVQFTPDLLPADILGSAVYSPRDGSFTFKEGPIFAQVLLADEINRASPRTQSALLEAMSEQQVSSDGVTRPVPSPFLVLATQNPVEFHGTYPLPEAQLDRFGLRIELGYPAAERELEVLYAQASHHPLDAVQPVLSAEEVMALQAETREVRVDRSLGRYVVALAEATRRHPSVRLGCSPRGSLMLFRSAQARALLEGRSFVVPEDVKAQAVPVLAHRLGLETKARYTGLAKEDVQHGSARRVLDLHLRRDVSAGRLDLPDRHALSAAPAEEAHVVRVGLRVVGQDQAEEGRLARPVRPDQCTRCLSARRLTEGAILAPTNRRAVPALTRRSSGARSTSGGPSVPSRSTGPRSRRLGCAGGSRAWGICRANASRTPHGSSPVSCSLWCSSSPR